MRTFITSAPKNDDSSKDAHISGKVWVLGCCFEI